MSPVHIHLLLNHVAILAALFSVVLFLFGMIRKNGTIQNVALSGYILSAVATVPVFLTGEPSEEAVENLPGILESVIEQHEEAAEIALWLIELTGILALGKFLFRKVEFFRSTAFGIIMAVVSVASASSIAYTGYLGGKIRHTEIAGGANAGGGEQGGGEQGGGEQGDDD